MSCLKGFISWVLLMFPGQIWKTAPLFARVWVNIVSCVDNCWALPVGFPNFSPAPAHQQLVSTQQPGLSFDLFSKPHFNHCIKNWNLCTLFLCSTFHFATESIAFWMGGDYVFTVSDCGLFLNGTSAPRGRGLRSFAHTSEAPRGVPARCRRSVLVGWIKNLNEIYG